VTVTMFTVQGDQIWQQVPGLTLVANVPLLIRGSGSVQPWGGESINADGDFSIQWDQSVEPTLNFCMLIGRYGTGGAVFGAGTAYADPNPPAGSTLFFAPNDGVNFDDNLDSFSVEISTEQDAFDNIIAELNSYGITVHQDGVPAGMTNGQAWTFAELQQLLIAVQTSARSLYFAKYNKSDRGPTVPADIKTLFKNIIHTGTTNLNVYRVTNSFTFGGGDSCDGTQDAGCTSNGNNAIALYGAFYLSTEQAQYTIAHELGHRFNNQSATGGGTSLSSRLDGTNVILDCDTARVLGRAAGDDDWLRGARGWGDVIPAGVVYPQHTVWQQNIITAEPPADQTTEIDEATADMFLNWVYRRYTDPISPAAPDCPNRDLKTIGSWLGFRNIKTDDATFDNSLPGDARYWWITQQIADIFDEHPSWIR